MHTLEIVAIFVIVLFCYIHLHFHLKVSNEREVHRLQGSLQGHLDDLCSSRQPVVFKSPHHPEFAKQYSDTALSKSSAAITAICGEQSLPYIEARKSGICRVSREALDRSNLLTGCATWLAPLKPVGTTITKHELVHGVASSSTPLTQEFSYRHYIIPCDARITVKLVPPSFSKYATKTSTGSGTFAAYAADGWEWTEGNGEIEITVEPGQALFVPSHWWYSMKFNTAGVVSQFRFVTAVNQIVNARFSTSDWIARLSSST